MTKGNPLVIGRLTFEPALDSDGDLSVDVDCDCLLSTYLADVDLIALRDHLNTLLKDHE